MLRMLTAVRCELAFVSEVVEITMATLALSTEQLRKPQLCNPTGGVTAKEAAVTAVAVTGSGPVSTAEVVPPAVVATQSALHEVWEFRGGFKLGLVEVAPLFSAV